MNEEFLRYSCQIALPDFSVEKQQLLKNAKVLIVGAGGLGCPAALYLVSSGVGSLTIADDDIISIGNLHRQILFNPNEIGQKKVIVAAEKLRQQNPQIEVIPLDVRITSENVMDIIKDQDIIVDGTDNFDTKYLLNDACVLSGKPLVHGAIYQYEGQVAVWNILQENGKYSPNFRDIFPDVDASKVPNCAEGGVIPTLAGIIGCMQANEVIKYLTKSKGILSCKLLLFNAVTMESRVIHLGDETHTEITSLEKTVFIPTLSVEAVKEDMNKGILNLVDVRTTEERNDFNIGGVHIPVNEFDYENYVIEGNKSIVFYCASGKRSGEVVKKIKSKYPTANVYSMVGGLKSWKESLSVMGEQQPKPLPH